MRTGDIEPLQFDRQSAWGIVVTLIYSAVSIVYFLVSKALSIDGFFSSKNIIVWIAFTFCCLIIIELI